jgi:hypothetical protein
MTSQQATPLHSATIPKADDPTLCARCLSLLMFNADLSLREMTASEYLGLSVEMQEILLRYRLIAELLNQCREWPYTA